MPDDLVRASGLWLKDGKRGKYMSGETREAIPAGARLFVFRNDKKAQESEPDYTLCYVTPEDQPPMRRAEPGQRSQQAAPEVDDSEIPF